MDKLRIDRAEKRIEVNDDGEYIILRLGDQSFLPSLMRIVSDFESSQNTYQEQAQEIDKMPDETEEEKFAKTKSGLELNLQVHQVLKTKIDGVFKDDVCRKVFGDIVPSVDMYEDFFRQLAPYIQKYAEIQAAKVKKYNAYRKGNV